jgi:hypothetical protein
MPEFDVRRAARPNRSSSSVPARRRPAALRLQRAVGNRATARLLRDVRAATAAEEAVEQAELAHDLADRAKLAARPTYPERAPHALKSAGIDTNTTKVDGDTPKWIQAALAESRLFRPYLSGKFPASAITDGKFEIHSTEKDFNRTYSTHRGEPAQLTDTELATRHGKIGGYFDRSKKTIHVRSRSTFGEAVHEAMHKLTLGFLAWDIFIDEGVTQFFADALLQEQGLPKGTAHSYHAELAFAERLVAATNFDMVARAYFLNDPTLRETMMRRFGLTLDQLQREIRTGTFTSRL